ncbi:hypothetical protein EV715DRAFT_206898 [Schizophyllum commune]
MPSGSHHSSPSYAAASSSDEFHTLRPIPDLTTAIGAKHFRSAIVQSTPKDTSVEAFMMTSQGKRTAAALMGLSHVFEASASLKDLQTMILVLWPHLHAWLTYFFTPAHNLSDQELLEKVVDHYPEEMALKLIVVVIGAIMKLLEYEDLNPLLTPRYSLLSLAASIYVRLGTLLDPAANHPLPELWSMALQTMASVLILLASSSEAKTEAVGIDALAAVGYRPCRLYRTLGVHMQCTIRTKDGLRTLRHRLQSIFPLTTVPHLEISRYPSQLIKGLVEVIRASTDDDILYAAYAITAHIFSQDTHAIRIAAELDIYSVLCTGTVPQAVFDCYLALIRCMEGSLVYRDVIKAFSSGTSTLNNDPPEPLRRLRTVALESIRTLDQFPAYWNDVVCCMNCGSQAGLYACTCGTAVYCSKTCQRAQWNNEHRTRCNKGIPPRLSARDVHFLATYVHGILQDQCLSAQLEACGYNACINMDLRLDRKVTVFPKPSSGLSPHLDIRVCVMRSNLEKEYRFNLSHPVIDGGPLAYVTSDGTGGKGCLHTVRCS